MRACLDSYPFFVCLFFNSHLRRCLLILGRGVGREKCHYEREKRPSVVSCVYPDWESNPQTLGIWGQLSTLLSHLARAGFKSLQGIETYAQPLEVVVVL